MDITQEIPAIMQLKKDIDDIIQRVRYLDNCKEVDICITKLQEAVMWLCMDLKRIHDTNHGFVNDPYPSSKDASTGTKIEPTADNLKF